jgi:hypothetical protein
VNADEIRITKLEGRVWMWRMRRFRPSEDQAICLSEFENKISPPMKIDGIF